MAYNVESYKQPDKPKECFLSNSSLPPLRLHYTTPPSSIEPIIHLPRKTHFNFLTFICNIDFSHHWNTTELINPHIFESY